MDFEKALKGEIQQIVHKRFHATKISVKQDGDSGDTQIEAILSETGIVDLDGDVIMEGAFDTAISEEQSPPMLFMHDRYKGAIGRWSDLAMDGTKLIANGKIFTGEDGFDLARQAKKLAIEELLKGVSIGFRLVKWVTVHTDERPWGWDILELDLLEASLVDVPANPSAEVTDIKRKLLKLREDDASVDGDIAKAMAEIGEIAAKF